MKVGERGEYGAGKWPKQKGSLPQRQLLEELVVTVDAAMGRVSSAHRDIARARLRELKETTNWSTSFITHNLGPKRCKYLAGIGWPISSRWLRREWGR
jgi:hypothetical protein